MSAKTSSRTAADIDESVAAAERAVLGAAMLSSTAFERASTIITGADFYSPAHELIWDAITWVNNQGTAENNVQADVTLTMTRLQATSDLEAAGGAPYLHSLIAGSITPTNAKYYANDVKEFAKARRMAMLGTRLHQGGTASLTADERDEILADAQATLDELAAGPAAKVIEHLGDNPDDVVTALQGGGAVGVQTGLADLDKIILALAGGEVCVVAARPRVGKTVVGMEVARNVATDGHGVLVFSLEMTKLELRCRMLNSMTRISTTKLNRKAPDLDDHDWVKISEAWGKFSSMPMHIADDGDMTPARMSALIGAHKRSNPGLKLVVIDYLQLVKSGTKTDSRQEEVSEISRQIKVMAKRHDVAVLLLAQVNRKSEDRSDRRPQMSDLRESGAVEQDADIVILLHREDVYEPEHVRAGEMDLIVEKNRAHGAGTATVAAQMHCYRLSDMARDWQQQQERHLHAA